MDIEPNDVLMETPEGSGTRRVDSPGEEGKGGNVPLERSHATEAAGCPPPDEPITVYCLHCGKEYMSSEMIPPDGERTPIMMDGLWWCPTPGCNAGGFGLDIFPVDPGWKDPKGLLHIIGDDDDDEIEWDDEDDEDDEP